jgi:hypothetical protein
MTSGFSGHDVRNSPPWPEAGLALVNELRARRPQLAIVTGEAHAVVSLEDRLVTDLDLRAVRLGTAVAGRVTPPTADDLQQAVGSADIVADAELLLWPALGVPILPFIAGLARHRPLFVVWPGDVAEGRARYSIPGRPDHHDERLSDVVVLRPRPTRFPDELPYHAERIAR